jgi:CO/xanthine dehydrogenase Mo-binding subunit
MVEMRVIGKPVGRPDGIDKVTGRARYSADHAPAGVLWGRALHSPHAHARILRIDTAAARSLPGVHAVLTGADIEAGLYGRAIKDVPVLAVDRVRYAGERVAAVAADDEDTAQAALDLVEVEYELLPAVFDPLEAIKDGAPLLHPDFASYPGGKAQERPSNAYSGAVNERGDVEQGFRDADVIVENTYTTQRQHQAYLEPQTVLVEVEGEKVQVWTCSKAPYDTRGAIAAAAVRPSEDIVFNHTYIGGDFGGKATPANLPICYFLARATRRPVLMVLDYIVEEFMAADPRHATVIKLKTGVKRDGSITAHTSDSYVNTGAFAGYKPLGIIGGAIRAATAGAYKIDNARLASMEIYTNTVPCGHMRSPGEPQAVFALESHMDEVARAIGMDPLAFRLRNVVRDGEATAMGAQHQLVRGVETLELAAKACGWDEERPALTGRGIAMCDRAPVGGEGNLEITLRADGSVLLGTAIFDQGTGTYATLVQVVAEELQLPPERVSFEVWPTGAVSGDAGIGGMRATRVNTLVAYEASQATRQALFDFVAQEMGWPADELVLRGAEVRWTDHEEAVAWPELLTRTGKQVSGRGHVNEQGRTQVTCFAAQVAEVRVDPETGEVKLLRLTSAHDVGQIVNPLGHQGQINGGAVQGIGYGLMEELKVEDGRVTTLSFGDYKIPTTQDIPEMLTVTLPPQGGVGPYQIKGIGETPNTPTAAAIANAVADAAGVRIRDLPITPEKVYRALRQRDA